MHKLVPFLFAPLFLGHSVQQDQAVETRAAPTVEQVAEPLQRFAPLVGTRWRAAFPGGELHDTQEFEWMLGGQFVRNVHRVTSDSGEVVYEGETVWGWDHEAERLRWWYFNSTGGQVIGDLVDQEGRWIAEGRNFGPEGQTSRVRSEMVVGADGWTSTSLFLEGEEWKERFTMNFVAVE